MEPCAGLSVAVPLLFREERTLVVQYAVTDLEGCLARQKVCTRTCSRKELQMRMRNIRAFGRYGPSVAMRLHL